MALPLVLPLRQGCEPVWPVLVAEEVHCRQWTTWKKFVNQGGGMRATEKKNTSTLWDYIILNMIYRLGARCRDFEVESFGLFLNWEDF